MLREVLKAVIRFLYKVADFINLLFPLSTPYFNFNLILTSNPKPSEVIK